MRQVRHSLDFCAIYVTNGFCVLSILFHPIDQLFQVTWFQQQTCSSKNPDNRNLKNPIHNVWKSAQSLRTGIKQRMKIRHVRLASQCRI